MLNEWLTWWMQQLLSLLPGGVRPGAGGRGSAVTLALTANFASVDLSVRRGGRVGQLGRFPLTAAGMEAMRGAVGGRGGARAGAQAGVAELLLPPGLLLDQAVVLPLAAERDPERVLGYEMDRLTPFAAADLFWTWVVERRDRVRNQVHLRLYLTPRAPLLPVMQALAAAGVRLARIGAGGVSIKLDRAPVSAWRRRVPAALAAACVLLGVGLAAAPFIRQSREANMIERRISAARPAVDQAEALRRRAAAAAAGVDVLAAQRATSGDVLETLAVLTNTLPDDTVLTDLSMHARGIVITGQSGAAARLIAALAAEPGLRNPAFAAPVTRNDTTKSEGFSIRAEIAP